jgi:hypothetical protein
MSTTKTVALAVTALAVTVAAGVTVYAQGPGFGGDKIKFPTDLGTLYTTVDRADNKQSASTTPTRQPWRRQRKASRCRLAPS